MPRWKRVAQALPQWSHALPNLRKLRQVFDSAFYLAKYPDVAAAGVDPFRHYIEDGAAEGRKPHPLFDPDYYLLGIPEPKDLRETPLVDFLRRTGDRCINPHPLFDCASYLAAHPDARERKINPVLHYIHATRLSRADVPCVEVPFESAHILYMDVSLTVAFVDGTYASKAALGGPNALVWEDREGRMRFIAPPEQRRFFEVMKYDQLRAQSRAK